MRQSRDTRLFFALWPDEDVRDRISRHLENIALETGRPVPRYNWHLTLHFIGNTTLAEKTCLRQQAGMVKAGRFQLTLDQAGFFKGPKVFWLGCRERPGALLDLHGKLGGYLRRCDYQPERRPFSPHVTVARKVAVAPEAVGMDAIDWSVERFVLVESVSVAEGVRYEVIDSYALD